MFTYCLNSPINGSDKTGYRFDEPGGRTLDNHIMANCIMGGGAGGLVIVAATSGAFDWVMDAAEAVSAFFSTVIQNTYNWFSSFAGHSVEDELGSIASSYGNMQCKEAAKEMEEYLKKKGESFSLITIQFPTYPGFIYSNIANRNISENGIHVGILYKGRVYCNVHPLGLFETSWISDFEGVGRKIVTVTPVS